MAFWGEILLTRHDDTFATCSAVRDARYLTPTLAVVVGLIAPAGACVALYKIVLVFAVVLDSCFFWYRCLPWHHVQHEGDEVGGLCWPLRAERRCLLVVPPLFPPPHPLRWRRWVGGGGDACEGQHWQR